MNHAPAAQEKSIRSAAARKLKEPLIKSDQR